MVVIAWAGLKNHCPNPQCSHGNHRGADQIPRRGDLQDKIQQSDQGHIGKLKAKIAALKEKKEKAQAKSGGVPPDLK